MELYNYHVQFYFILSSELSTIIKFILPKKLKMVKVHDLTASASSNGFLLVIDFWKEKQVTRY